MARQSELPEGALVAKARWELAELWSLLRRNDWALEEARRALNLQTSLLPDKEQVSPAVVDGRLRLGLFQARAGQVNQAMATLDRAIAIDRQTDGEMDDVTAQAFAARVALFVLKGDYKGASALASAAPEEPLAKARLLHARGLVGLARAVAAEAREQPGSQAQEAIRQELEGARGRLESARQLGRQVALGGSASGSLLAAKSGEGLGYVLSAMGDAEAAEGLLTQTRDAYRELEGPDSAGVVRCVGLWDC